MLEKTHHLPQELKTLVNESLELFGHAAKNEFGQAVFSEVEIIRKAYKELRASDDTNKLKTHWKLALSLQKNSSPINQAIAHCFAASLEIINACESAYRSSRLKQQKFSNTVLTPSIPSQEVEPIIFVLTAHPTEARSQKAILILEQIHELLLNKILNRELSNYEQNKLGQLMAFLAKTPLSKSKAPTVQDEAEFIYTIILKDKNLEKLCDYYDKKQPVFIRTWVGGDKDGHPGVDEKAMLKSLSGSRKILVPYIEKITHKCYRQLCTIEQPTAGILKLKKKIMALGVHLRALQKLDAGDGIKLKRFYKTLTSALLSFEKEFNTGSAELEQIHSLMQVFPGMVVPLELREDSSVIAEALHDNKAAIAKMIQLLKGLSRSADPTWYVRGLVISMCESVLDVQNTCTLLKKNLGQLSIPIVPLFETRAALEQSQKLLKDILQLPDFAAALNKYWDKKVEIMVGYSDSAKESGALFSRVVIEKSLHKLDRQIRKEGLVPIFFHGSGGSVARGGGSLKEQLAWWPKSAQRRFKATIQGEMIYRTFSSAEIFERQVSKIRESLLAQKAERLEKELQLHFDEFAEGVRLHYFSKVNDPHFMNLVAKATPYPFLDQLKIGSRPSKRKSELNLKNLRAIPWVLCWTQTRALFPVWWGIGSQWTGSSNSQQQALIKIYKQSPLLSSFVRVLTYTLAKVDMSVWAYYIQSSSVEDSDAEVHINEFKAELKKTQQFVQDITGRNDSLWFRPWLEESIRLRSTLIYPLNILEVKALQSRDVPLLRETVTGIASGMLTTG